MATDMDIDMGPLDDDAMIQDVEILPEPLPTSHTTAPNNHSDPNAQQQTPFKVHLRGLDNLTTQDIKAFAAEHYSGAEIERIEWIDDTSANLVYGDSETAREAVLAFAADQLLDITQLPVLQTLPATAFPLKPQTNLEVRIAVVGDRKQAGARERSRFYLFNPEHDPAERRRGGTGPRGGNKYRVRDDDYRGYCYDDREHQKRQARGENSMFDASLYDDDEAALALRASRKHKRSASGSSEGDTRSRRVRHRVASGIELFPDHAGRGGARDGRLRDRSASPYRGSDGHRETTRRPRDNAASANRLKAQMIKAQLRTARPAKELFPTNSTVSHRRSAAFDAADETADLFAHKMPPVPFLDGSGDQRPKNGQPLASRITSKDQANGSYSSNSDGFSIRGAAKVPATQSFSIKGSASGGARELFGGNHGKELFAEKLEGRGSRRQKAEDLFY